MFPLSIELSGPAIGILLKEAVRRALVVIRNQRLTFSATAKEGHTGNMDDVFTSADTAAQKVYEEMIRETLPGVGIIGEEGLNLPCTIKGHDVYVTIDPLDGTKAFVRRQSHGVATMVALVVNGEIVSAWIGDVNTGEIYGYRPESEKVHRITALETSQYLHTIDRVATPLLDQYLLLRNFKAHRHPPVQKILDRFRDVHVDGSSIGTWFTRLWKGEMGAVVLDPSPETPWDATPFIGISQHLGFEFFRPTDVNGWEEYEPIVPKETFLREHYTLVVHESLVGQLLF